MPPSMYSKHVSKFRSAFSCIWLLLLCIGSMLQIDDTPNKQFQIQWSLCYRPYRLVFTMHCATSHWKGRTISKTPILQLFIKKVKSDVETILASTWSPCSCGCTPLYQLGNRYCHRVHSSCCNFCPHRQFYHFSQAHHSEQGTLHILSSLHWHQQNCIVSSCSEICLIPFSLTLTSESDRDWDPIVQCEVLSSFKQNWEFITYRMIHDTCLQQYHSNLISQIWSWTIFLEIEA